MKHGSSSYCYTNTCPLDILILTNCKVKRFIIESSILFNKIVYLFKVTNDCNFRYYNPFSFFKTASNNMIAARNIPLQRQDTVRADLFIMDDSAGKKELYKGDVGQRIITKWLGSQATVGSPIDREKIFMGRFLENSSENKLPKITDMDMLKFLPGGAPLISYLEVDNASSQEGYQFPTQLYLEELANRRSLDTETVSGVENREITLGKSQEHEVVYHLNWALEKIKEDKVKYPANFCSFDMKMVPFPIDRYRELMKRGKNWETNPEPMVVQIVEEGPNTINIPTRILLGNGVTWTLSIRFNYDLTKDEKGQGQLNLSLNPLPEAFMDFFSSLHLLTGQYVIMLRNGLQDYLSEVYGIQRELPPVMQIDALSTAAGWKLSTTNRFSTNLATLGGILSPKIRFADSTWALDWNQLPMELKTYCVGNLRSDYSSYIVFMSLLMRNTFPDIEILSSTLELTQTQAIEWFTWLVSVCVGESVPEPGSRLKAKTRQDLILSLRKYDYSSKPKKLYEDPEDTAILLSKLIPDWPTVVHGGPRFLHSVLPFFVEQIQILQSLNKAHPYLAPLIKREIDDKFIKRCTYNRGMDRENVYQGTEDFGLGCKPEFTGKIYKIDLSKLTDKDITAMADQTGQAKVLGILESVRLSIETCTPLLRKLRTLDLDSVNYSFWLEKTSLYEELRLMHFFLLNDQTVAVERLEEEVHTRQKNVLQQEEETRARDEKIVENRKKREDLYQANQIYAQGGTRNRTGLQQQIYGQVPGDHKERNKKWRESKKKMYQKVKRLNNYIPRKEWKVLGKKGDRPTRANPYNVRTEGLDLRQVLINKNEKPVTQATQETIEYQGRLVTSENDSNLSQMKFTADPDRRVYLEFSERSLLDVSDHGCNTTKPRFVSQIKTPGQYSPRGTPPRRYRTPSPRLSYQPKSPSPRYSYQPRSLYPRYLYQQSSLNHESRPSTNKRVRSPSPGCSYQPRYPSPKRYRTPSPAVGASYRYRSPTPEYVYQEKDLGEYYQEECYPDEPHSQRDLYQEDYVGKAKGKGKSARQVTVTHTTKIEGYWQEGFQNAGDNRRTAGNYPKRN